MLWLEDLERFVLPGHILWKMVVAVDHHPCCFMPHFSWFQLPAMSLCSALPCQTEERQDFLPMEMIIRCNQTISRSSFWHETQIEVVWSHKIINCLFPVLNHFSASFVNHLQLFSAPFRNEDAQSTCSALGLASPQLHTGRKLPPCTASGACRRGLGEPCRSECGSACCSVTCLRTWVHPRSRTRSATLQLLGLGRASLWREGSTGAGDPSTVTALHPSVGHCCEIQFWSTDDSVPHQPSRSPVEAPPRAAFCLAARGPLVASCRVLLIWFLSKCDARQSWVPAGLSYPHPVYNLLRKRVLCLAASCMSF